MRPKVEVWDHGVRTLSKISKRYPQLAYSGLGMSVQIEWQYLQRTVPGVGTLMGPIEDALIEAILPALFGGEEVRAYLREILGHIVKRGGLGIPEPRLSSERAYNTPKAANEVLVGSLIVGTDLNYIARKGCVRRAIKYGRKQ